VKDIVIVIITGEAVPVAKDAPRIQTSTDSYREGRDRIFASPKPKADARPN
jgi:hypothetical protein